MWLPRSRGQTAASLAAGASLTWGPTAPSPSRTTGAMPEARDPGFQTKRHRSSGDVGVRATAPSPPLQTRPRPGGRPGCSGRRGVQCCASRSILRVPAARSARRPHAPLGEPPGPRAPEGAGIPEWRRSWSAPAPGSGLLPTCLPLLWVPGGSTQCPCQLLQIPGFPGSPGSPGSQPAPASLGAPAGGDRAPPLSRDWRPE